MGRNPVENIGRYGSATDPLRNQYDHRDRNGIERYDTQPIDSRLDSRLKTGFVLFQEKRDGHRHHRKDTRSQQCSKSP